MTQIAHVVVTNDDGIDAPGLNALAKVAVDLGFDVTIVAPHRAASGTGAGLTMFPEIDDSIAVTEHHLPGLENVPAYAVSAHPGMISLAVMLGRFGHTPDLVLSGINEGSNLGSAVLHSGTAGAALVAGAHGATALAVSLHLDFEVEQPLSDPPRHWESAASVTRDVLSHIIANPARAVYNVNVPNVPVQELRELTHGDWTLHGTGPSLLPFLARFDEHANGLPVGTSRETPIEFPRNSDIEQVRAGHPTISMLELVGDSSISWLAHTPDTSKED